MVGAARGGRLNHHLQGGTSSFLRDGTSTRPHQSSISRNNNKTESFIVPVPATLLYEENLAKRGNRMTESKWFPETQIKYLKGQCDGIYQTF